MVFLSMSVMSSMSNTEMIGFWIRRGVTEHDLTSTGTGGLTVSHCAGVASKRDWPETVYELT